MKNLNYLMGHILYQIFKIILNIFFKKNETFTDNPSIRIYINKIENRITFKIKRILSPTFNAWNNEITWKD